MAIIWNNTPVVDSIQLPGSSDKYWVKDTEAREKIEDLVSATHFLGVTTTPLEDECDTNPIVINNEEVTAVSGDIAIYKQTDHVSLEFIFDGTHWQLLGGQAIEGAGHLAYADTASTDYTPEGNVLINITSSDNSNIITSVSLGNLDWILTSSESSQQDFYYVLTDVDVSSSSSFISSLSYNTTYAGSQTDSGELPSLTSVGVSGVDASMSGTTLIFTAANIGYSFSAGSFPTYSFEDVVSDMSWSDSSVSVECSTSGHYIGTSKSGNLYVDGDWLTATFSGSSTTITVEPDNN
jgi:hypothetical protein